MKLIEWKSLLLYSPAHVLSDRRITFVMFFMDHYELELGTMFIIQNTPVCRLQGVYDYLSLVPQIYCLIHNFPLLDSLCENV